MTTENEMQIRDKLGLAGTYVAGIALPSIVGYETMLSASPDLPVRAAIIYMAAVGVGGLVTFLSVEKLIEKFGIFNIPRDSSIFSTLSKIN